MTITAFQYSKLEVLQAELQKMTTNAFEELVVCMVAELIQVDISVAKSGFQFGGDGGTGGRQGRVLRIECKRYLDTTSLNERELLGEVDHALSRDELLEVWVLASTRDVPEQLENSLNDKSLKVGVPIIIIDWKKDRFNSLAALCCSFPELLKSKVSNNAHDAILDLRPDSKEALERLKKDLQSWSIGFDSLLKLSHEKLDKIWNSERDSRAYFGQDVAGGKAKAIGRKAINRALDSWWCAKSNNPIGLLGYEGVGKTWAATSWMVKSKSDLPIIILIPSSISLPLKHAGLSLKEFIAQRLADLTTVNRGAQYWLKRTEALLKRPVDEGPALLLFFDGLNQESSVDWVSVFQKLQTEELINRIRVVFSTRKLHFEERLNSFRGLIDTPEIISVGNYEDSTGGEFDQKLSLEGMKRSDLPEELIETARNPRLFNLVLSLRDRLNDSTAITIHRVLWEYGKDSVGVRANRSFSESEWQNWLKGLASTILDGGQEFTLNEISRTAQSPYLSENEIYARLSEIVDGNFTIKRSDSGNHEFRPEIVAHALGIALLSDLSKSKADSFEDIESKLNSWLDPIAGLDQRSEALRAAVSIIIERNDQSFIKLAGVLVTAWLQSQNLPDRHIDELTKLSQHLCEPLLDALEHSKDYAQSSPRSWAAHALRSIPRNDFIAYDTIIQRSVEWLRITPLNKMPAEKTSLEYENHRHERIMSLIGDDNPGKRIVLGREVIFVNEHYREIEQYIPALIEGFPLAKAMPIFEMASISHSINYLGKLKNNLDWLVMLNQIDLEETLVNLRKLSNEIKNRIPEKGINPRLPNRVASMVLFISPEESDEIQASNLNEDFDKNFDYESDYLSSPGYSFFNLERRHTADVLKNRELNLLHRIRKASDCLLDPTFEIPQEFQAEIKAYGNTFDVSKLDTSRSRTAEDIDFEQLEVVFARCAPEMLADLMKRKLNFLRHSLPTSRYIRSLKVGEQFLLAENEQKESIRELRSQGPAGTDNEWHVASLLLMLEIHGKPALEQAEALLQANVDTILVSMDKVLSNLSVNEAEILVSKYSNGTQNQLWILLFLLNRTNASESELLWQWLINIADSNEPVSKQEAFECLYKSDAVRFGKHLHETRWVWSPAYKDLTNVYGTLSLLEATCDYPFETIYIRLAPWLLLDAVHRRGSKYEELNLALILIDEIIQNPNNEIPELGSEVTVNVSARDKYLENFNIRIRQSDSLMEDLALDQDKKEDRYLKAINVAIERITKARKDGFRFYLFNFSFLGLELLLKLRPDYVDALLTGLEEDDESLKRKVIVNGNFYYALCEALLKLNPELGKKLWQKLWGFSYSINYTNEAGLKTLTHMIFRVPSSRAVDELRLDIIEPKYANTDLDLFNIALAATLSDCTAWLINIIEKDLKSHVAWKRRRAIVLNGFILQDNLSIPKAWPDKYLVTSYERLTSKSAFGQLLGAIAAHHWNSYLNAKSRTEAYAAWILFLNSADRRSWALFRDLKNKDFDTEIEELKFTNWNLNISVFKNYIKKREGKFKGTYLGLEIPDGFGYWMN